MQMSHKGQVVIQFLVPVSVGYLALAFLLVRGSAPSITAVWDNAGALALLTVAAMLVQDLIPKPLKEFLVFFRAHDRLPGHRAFSELAIADPRIDPSNIENFDQLSALTPSAQNKTWYINYLKFADQEGIRHYSIRYIGWRDTAIFSAVLATVTFPAIATIQFDRTIGIASALTAASFVLYALSVAAARAAARELLISVLVRMETESC